MLEIIAQTIEDAIAIEKGGGDRIELVSALSEGGLTPSYGIIEAVINHVSIPVNVMIRPHAKNFVYTDAEINSMKTDIQIAKKLGANAVVFGILTEANQIDLDKTKALLDACGDMPVTFHRAIDETNLVESIKQLSTFPQITTVLTSGGLTTPIAQNTEVLNDMHTHSGHIDLLLGGGLSEANITDIKNTVTTTSFHFGTAVQTTGTVDATKVAAIKSLLQK